MKLVNATKNISISSDFKLAVTFWDRLFGLLDKRNPRFLLFKTHFGLHTFFLENPIDLILLDNENKVIKTKTDLKPFRFFFYPPRYQTVIEMPEGTLEKSRAEIGDKISFE